MATLKFGSMASQLKLLAGASKVSPEEEVIHLKEEVRFLKNILHMKQSASGGLSQILYNLKQLKDENEKLKRLDKSRVHIDNMVKQNTILRKKLEIKDPDQYQRMKSSQGLLPYLDIKNKRRSILQRTAGSTNLYSKGNEMFMEDQTPKSEPVDLNFKGRPAFKSNGSLGEIPKVTSPFEDPKKHSKTEISELDDTLAISLDSRRRSFRIDNSPEASSKLSKFKNKSGLLPSINIQMRMAENRITRLDEATPLKASKSHNPSSTKLKFSDFMQDQHDKPFFKKKLKNNSVIIPRRHDIRNSSPKVTEISNFRSTNVEEVKISLIKSKLDGLKNRLIAIDEPSDPLLGRPERRRGSLESRPFNSYSRDLISIKQQMELINFC